MLRRFMQRSVDLDRHARAHDCEIRNVSSDRMLSPHGDAFIAQRTKQ